MDSPLRCFYCKKNESSVGSLIKHLKKENVLPYKCSMSECSDKIFGNSETIRSHIKNHLKKITSNNTETINVLENLFDDYLMEETNKSMEEKTPFQENILKKLSSLRHEFLKIFIPIYGNENIARKHSIENTRSLCEYFIHSLELIQASISSFDINVNDKEQITTLINELKDSVNIGSEYMLLKELEKSEFYVKSKFVEFARTQQEYLNKENNIKIRNDIFGVSVFPLQPAFYKLFNNTTILHEILVYIETIRTSKTVINYMQGIYIDSFYNNR